MGDNLKQIKVEKPVDDVIEFCKQLLERAQSGHLIGLVCVRVERENVCKPTIVGNNTYQQIALGVTVLNAMVQKQVLEASEDEL